MKTCRRAWNIASRRNPGKLPTVNPFAAMGLISSGRETPTATFGEPEAVAANSGRDGTLLARHGSPYRLGVAATCEDNLGVFDATHYRPKVPPSAFRVPHAKRDEENWVPLFDDAGVPLYPELKAWSRTPSTNIAWAG